MHGRLAIVVEIPGVVVMFALLVVWAIHANIEEHSRWDN